MSKIVLASASPRRKELLEQVGIEFEICPSQGEERITQTKPSDVVLELSRQKAESVAAMLLAYNEAHPQLVTPTDIMVIGADTIVALEDRILGKPKDDNEAKEMLGALQGNTHSVYTGVTLVFIDKSGKVGEHAFYDKTDVTMYPMTMQEIERYVSTSDGADKAGSYGIQGRFAIHIKEINGDYNNVVGLPISRIYQELLKVGIDWFLW